MLKELVCLAERIEKDKNGPPERTGGSKSDKFVVVSVDDEIEKVGEVSLLEDDFKGFEWLKEYKGKIKDCSFSAGNNNKALGSVSGLLTFSPFSFKLTQKNFDGFIKKFKKTKLSDRQTGTLPEKIVSEWSKIRNIEDDLYENIKSLTEKTEIINSYVLICPGKEKFEEWMECVEDLRSMIFAQLKAGDKDVDGKCPSCSKSKTDKLNLSSELYSFNSKKPYLKSVTKKGKIKYPYIVCQECRNKISLTFRFLKDRKIKFLPLIIKFIGDEKYFQFFNEEGKNKFRVIFNEYAKDKKDNFNFYLLINTRNYFSIDDVNGYGYVLGEFYDYFENRAIKKNFSRCDFEIEIKRILGMYVKNFDDYFEDKIKPEVIYMGDLIYSCRSKLFDYVYRGKSTLHWRDVGKIVCQRLARDMRNEVVNRGYAKGWLNTYFNFRNNFEAAQSEPNKSENENFNFRNNFERLGKMDNKEDNKVTFKFVEEVENALGSKEEIIISDDKMWAYLAGQVAYYLVSQSEADNKSYALLEPFSNATQDKVVKIKIIDLFKKYKHKIPLGNVRFKTIMSAVLKYDIEKDFSDEDIKPSFYAGIFDNNVIYKKRDKEADKNE